MTKLYFNPLAIDTVQKTWDQSHFSNFTKAKDLVQALKHDLFVKNPYDLVVCNFRNIILNDSKSKTEKIAAASIVFIAFIYTNLVYGLFTYSFIATLHKTSVFINSAKLIRLTTALKEIANRIILMLSKPIGSLFYKIPKRVLNQLPCAVKIIVEKACETSSFVFNNIVAPFFKLIKKILFWNQLQIILAVRLIFDKTMEIYDFVYQNAITPFWELKVRPKVSRMYQIIQNVKQFRSYIFA